MVFWVSIKNLFGRISKSQAIQQQQQKDFFSLIDLCWTNKLGNRKRSVQLRFYFSFLSQCMGVCVCVFTFFISSTLKLMSVIPIIFLHKTSDINEAISLKKVPHRKDYTKTILDIISDALYHTSKFALKLLQANTMGIFISSYMQQTYFQASAVDHNLIRVNLNEMNWSLEKRRKIISQQDKKVKSGIIKVLSQTRKIAKYQIIETIFA